ncbi:MAG: MotA/TolQ/ExbB proton channel family protein [Spirochaetes bacterium]|nr:MotA/TolQ/ExbB proton channel family protein [Spirochaetota bacterium]
MEKSKFQRIIILSIAMLMLAGLFSYGQQDATAPAAAQTAESASKDNATSTPTGDDKNGANNQVIERRSFSLRAFFREGGPFMWPILILTAFGFAIAIERTIYFFRARLASREFIDLLERTVLEKDLTHVEEVCKSKNNTLSKIILKGLEVKHLGFERVEKTISVAASVEVASLERHLSMISAIANISPMLGFLGTVTGMVTAFNDIAAADHISAKIVATGIREALLTTVFGLIAAIPLSLIYNFFVSKIEGFVTSVERISADIIEKFIKTKNDNSST